MEALLAALEADPRLKSRPRRTVAAAALAVGLTAAGVGFAMHARTDECAPDPIDLRGVWDDAARNELTAAFVRSGAPDGHDVATRVIHVMNETAAKWVSMKAESCEATRIKKRQPEDVYKLRSECLDRRRGELRALSTSFRVADKEVVEKAVAAAYGLTNVIVCSDVSTLRKSGGLPDAPDARAKVIEARADLASATSFELVGKLAESADEGERALALARSAGHQSTVAEALRTLGGLKVEQNEHGQAERLLTEATWTASKAGDDPLVVTTASALAFVVRSKAGTPRGGAHLARRRRCCASVASGPPGARAGVRGAQGLAPLRRRRASRGDARFAGENRAGVPAALRRPSQDTSLRSTI